VVRRVTAPTVFETIIYMVNNPAAEPGASTRAKGRRDEPALTILIVDDVADTREMYAAYFKHVGAGVLKAQDGAAALDLTREHRPDVVLLDLTMPHMSGKDVLVALRADPSTRDIPVVILTGHAMPGTQAEVNKAGADLFLTKPCLPHVVFSFILHLFRQRGGGH
jgi:twitching motility two-component system response regulator PilH